MYSGFKVTWYSWFVLFLNALFLFYKYILQVSPSVMTGQLMQRFHLTGAGLGNLAATYFYTFLITQFFVGFILDKYSTRFFTSLAILICSFGTWFFSVSNTLLEAELSRGLIGVGVSFATVSYMKQASVWFPKNKLAFIGGLLATAVGIGVVIGQAPLAYMVDNKGWRDSLQYVALVGFILTLLYFVFARDKNPLNNNLDKKNSLTFSKFKNTIMKKQNILLTFYSGLAFSPLAVFSGLWGDPFLQVSHNLTNAKAADFITFSFLGLGLGAPFFGYVSDKLGHRCIVMAIGTFVSLLSLCFIIYVPSISDTILLIEMFFFGLGTGAFMLGFTLGKEWNDISMSATIVALINTGDALFGAISEPLVGKLLDIFSKGVPHHRSHFNLSYFHKAFFILPIYLVVALVLTFFLNKFNPQK